jgi:hypothetical protein
MFDGIGSIRLDSARLRRCRHGVIGLVAAVTALVGTPSPVQAQADGPVAAYGFSDTSGATAVDSSGNGNDAGLVNGAMSTAGRFSGALQLDGVDDGVQLPSTESLAFSNAFTFEAWIAPTMFGHERNVWRTPGAVVTLRAEGTVVPVAILTGGQVGFVSSRTIPLDTWAHVAITYDGSMLRLYINGAEAGHRAATGTLLPGWPEAGSLGGSPAFAGSLDEVRLYRRALSVAEIRLDAATPVDPTVALEISARTPSPNAVGVVQTAVTTTFSRAVDASTITTSTFQLFDAGNVPVPTTVTYDAATRTAALSPTRALMPLTSYTMMVAGGTLGLRDAQGVPLAIDDAWTFRTAAAEDAPSAAYSFSETSGATAIDWSGNDNDAVLVDGPTRTTGRFGDGLRMDGIDDTMQLPLTETLTFSSAFTFEAWIAPTAVGRERSLWWTPAAMLTLGAGGRVVPVAVLTGGQIGFLSTGVVPTDTWSHVAMTYDGSMLRLYINGADAGSNVATGTLVPSAPPLAGTLGGASAFEGTIDEVRLYRRALSATEIAADMMTPVDPASAPLTVTAVTPVGQDVHPHSTISATFGRAAVAASVTTATVQLRDSANHVVAASVTYDHSTRTVTLTPTIPLTAATEYHARVLSGSGGVRAEDGGELASDVQWSFRTAAAPPPVTAVPHVTWLHTTSGPVGQVVFIYGSHFGARQGTSTLTFNGKRATVVLWSSSWIVVIVPTGATTGPLVVAVGGKTSNPVKFTVTRPRSHR